MRKWIVLCVTVCFLLAGCTAVEPENRAFPLIVSIDYQNGNYEVIYGIPDLSKVTGQDKKGESGSESARVTVYSGKSLRDVELEFDKSQKNYLDLGHMKALILGEGLQNDRQAFIDCLDFLENEPSVAGNIYVFSCSQVKELMELNGYEIDSLGDYLTGMIENKPISHKERIAELQELYNAWHNQQDFPKLLTVGVKENQVYFQ